MENCYLCLLVNIQFHEIFQNNKKIVHNISYNFFSSGSCKIDEMSNSNKACLISTSPPNEAMILKCFMKLMCNGKEIISYNGNVFSIDETKNVHSWNSGGLIYPSNLMWDHLGLAGLEILVSVK